jgi:hypothetical protein
MTEPTRPLIRAVLDTAEDRLQHAWAPFIAAWVAREAAGRACALKQITTLCAPSQDEAKP